MVIQTREREGLFCATSTLLFLSVDIMSEMRGSGVVEISPITDNFVFCSVWETGDDFLGSFTLVPYWPALACAMSIPRIWWSGCCRWILVCIVCVT